jgi:hypothetical protein
MTCKQGGDENEKHPDEVLTVNSKLFRRRPDEKMLNDPSVPSAKIIPLFPSKV